MHFGKLKTIVDKSNATFIEIKEKYPGLSGHLVFSSPYGQCNLTTDLIEILKAFPDMIVDSPQKEKVIGDIQNIVSLEKEKKDNGDAKGNITEKIKRSRSDVLQMIDSLSLREDVFVEIRFDEKKVNLPLIFKLQKDELVSQEHTPQTKTSIRIVLGTFAEICEAASSLV